MYLNFYNLRKEPFHITPDPEFLYLSPSHKEALAAIIYCIEYKKGFVAIIGDVGVGKTTVLRSYLDSAERKSRKIIYVFNARLTFEGLLKTIFQDLEIENPPSDTMEMVNKLYEVLIEEYKQGNSVVLVIDEAQNMPIETLENLRMLSNLETSKDKLIQIVLVGQNEFEETLNLSELHQLKQRIAIRSRIVPLTRTESLDYTKYRLQKAGSNHDSVFTNVALKNIINEADGIPRIINILCDNALIAGFGYQEKPVGTKVVKEVIADFRGKKRSSFSRWWIPAASTLSAIVLLALFMRPHAGVLVKKIEMFASSPQSEPVAQVSAARKEIRKMNNIKQAESTVSKQVESQKVSGQKSDQPTQIHGQAEVPQPVEESRPRAAARARTVKPGDTLTKLAEETYGKADEMVFEVIKKNNPQLSNINLIHAGSKIVLPAPEGQQ